MSVPPSLQFVQAQTSAAPLLRAQRQVPAAPSRALSLPPSERVIVIFLSRAAAKGAFVSSTSRGARWWRMRTLVFFSLWLVID